MSAPQATQAVPLPAASLPLNEAVQPAMGSHMSRYALDDHRHQRLSSASVVTLGASGMATVTFTRPFDVEPVPVLTEIMDSGTGQPMICAVTAWTKTGSQWTGATIKGWRSSSTTLAAVTVLGISVAVGAQTINPFGGSAVGARVACVFIQPSDQP